MEDYNGCIVLNKLATLIVLNLNNDTFLELIDCINPDIELDNILDYPTCYTSFLKVRVVLDTGTLILSDFHYLQKFRINNAAGLKLINFKNNTAPRLYKCYKKIQDTVIGIGENMEYIMNNIPNEIKLLGEVE